MCLLVTILWLQQHLHHQLNQMWQCVKIKLYIYCDLLSCNKQMHLLPEVFKYPMWHQYLSTAISWPVSHLSLTSCAAVKTEETLLVSIWSSATWAAGWEASRAKRAAWARCMFRQARQSWRPSESWDRRRSQSARPMPLHRDMYKCVATLWSETSEVKIKYQLRCIFYFAMCRDTCKHFNIVPTDPIGTRKWGQLTTLNHWKHCKSNEQCQSVLLTRLFFYPLKSTNYFIFKFLHESTVFFLLI